MEKNNIIFLISIISLIFITNIVYADCITSLDDYAVEVLLNKKDIQSNIDLLKNAENVNYINNNFIIQSSSSPNMAIILNKVSEPFCQDCISLRVQIPVNRTKKEVPYIEFSTTINNKNINITGGIENWSYNCLLSSCIFYKDSIIVETDNSVPNKTRINIEIMEDNKGGYCGGRVIYSLSKAFCITKQNKEDIENLLKEVGVINNFEELFISYKIEGSGTKIIYDFSPQLNEDFFSSLSKQNLTIDNETKLENLNWSTILYDEIEWMRFNGIISININDMKEISKLAKLGYSGVNKRIYYGIDSNGNTGWMYYYETAFPILTKFENCEEFDIKNIPSNFIYINQPDQLKISLYYIIPIAFSFALLIVLFVLIFIAKKKIKKELEKERKEILNKK